MMEKQKMEEKTMEENNKKNPDSERKSKLVSAVLMAFVCILMMGGGTYAWFTMGNTAKVTSLKLNVASEGNLRIAKTKSDVQSESATSEVEWSDDVTVKTLYPCTTINGVAMKKPVYETETKVSGATALTEGSDEAKSYYLQETFWLLLDDGITGDGAAHSDYTVHLAKGTSATADGTTTYDGTYFKSTATENYPERCVRVSFTSGGTTYVYEPNSDVHNNGTQGTDYAYDSVNTAVASGYVQKSDGTWTENPAGDTAGNSKEMFTITGGTPQEVVVRVWFEGTDTDCRNDIELKDILAQLKFVANKKAN